MEKNEFRTLLRAHDNIGLVGLVLLDSDSRQDALRLAKEELTKGRGREPEAKIAGRELLIDALTQIAGARHLPLDQAIAAVQVPSKPTGGTAKVGGETPVVA